MTKKIALFENIIHDNNKLYNFLDEFAAKNNLNLTVFCDKHDTHLNCSIFKTINVLKFSGVIFTNNISKQYLQHLISKNKFYVLYGTGDHIILDDYNYIHMKDYETISKVIYEKL
jgi:hypothetical protein